MMCLPSTSLKVGMVVLVAMNRRLYRVVGRIREMVVVAVQKISDVARL
jgi:hypothetical protein